MTAKPARSTSSTIAATAPAFRLLIGLRTAPSMPLPAPANDAEPIASMA